MTEPFDFDDGRLPDELRALDEELSSLRYEERASFEPELRAELELAWSREPMRRRAMLRRHLLAATVTGLLLAGASVPSARASLVRFAGSFVESLADEEALPPADPEPTRLAAEGPGTEPSVGMLDLGEALKPVELTLPSAPEAPTAEPASALPRMLDRELAEAVLQDAYPMHLQQRGIGGTVRLRLWIDENGLPGLTTVSESSGERQLDRIARDIVPTFGFSPARQDGRSHAAWIEFPVKFEPDPELFEPDPELMEPDSELMEPDVEPVDDPFTLPRVDAGDEWHYDEPLDLAALPDEPVDVERRDEGIAAAYASLMSAIRDPAFVESHGTPAAILAGEAPEGIAPTEWRAVVASALEHAITRATDTPAALLAFGRIRIRQGLRHEARSLFERGLERALIDAADVDSWVVAELHYERGSLVRDGWLAARGVGRVRAEAFRGIVCPQARSSGRAGTGFASTERLIAWNYLCPRELTGVFREGFEIPASAGVADVTLMMASYRAAIEARPSHVAANTDLLVTLACEGRWDDVLRGARRFARVSGGHPDALLLMGMALHRLERTREAAAHFEAAMDRMGPDRAEDLNDVRYLLDPDERGRYRRMAAEKRKEWEDRYWIAKDRRPSTGVNERRVEHLARSTFASLALGGILGDAGEVWVRFGRPDAVRVVDDGSGRLTEFWDYGSGPDITFVRWVTSERMDLTPEGRAYVDDLGRVFPPQ